jgi:hypothetical protein
MPLPPRRPRASIALTVVLALIAALLVGALLRSSTSRSPRARAASVLASGRRGSDPARGGRGGSGLPRESAGARSDPPAGAPVSVSVAAHPAGAAVPADFLGLSFEMRSLPTIADYAMRGDLVQLMRSLGTGVMRFGGVSADEQVAWAGSGSTRPAWASATVTEGDLAGLAGLARATGWRVLLTVNLAHYDPPAAAQEAAAARRLLGSYLAGVEIGNEPDTFVRKGLRGAGWSLSTYLAQAAAYHAAIHAAAPGVAIAGPDPSTGATGLGWLRAVASSPTLRPALLTDHYYPLSSCGSTPTVSELLSPNVRHKESRMLGAMLFIAHTSKTPVRLDETNSISCEGEPGVSNTFASALWALDFTTRAMTTGVAGLNFHDLIADPVAYSPLFAPTPAALAAGALHAAPEWYALLAARPLLGARPLPTSVTGAAPGELTASAFRSPDGRLQIVLVDYDPPGSIPLAVHLRVPRGLGHSNVLRLTAPSPTATSGVRLGGRRLAPDGSWVAPPVPPRVSGHAGALAVGMPPDSAAVVTLTPVGAVGHAALPR